MDAELFEHHLTSPRGRDRLPVDAATGVAGTTLCGDVVRVGLVLDAGGTRVADAGFEAEACGATIAAASAAIELAVGAPLLDVARIGAREVADALGGLSPGKVHAAELVADALARALGTAARASAALPARGEDGTGRQTPAAAPVRGEDGGGRAAPPVAPAAGIDASGASAALGGGAERVLVAMSGGVDSAVAALLTARSGAEVVAVTLELWADEEHDEERSCCSAQAVRGARALAHRMGLAHLTLDLRDEFRAGVVTPFLRQHAQGLTPNPCIGCNGHVRLDAMLALADRLGASALATGHYARVAADDPDPDRDDPDRDAAGPLLRAAADPAKDQTYMLAALRPASIARLRFPLGDLTKPAVRALAAEAGLPVASKADSQDLCFLAGTSRAAFLARHGGIEERPGEIVDRAGRVIGRHRGQHGFTVGQRKGLGVAAGEPLYVLAKDARHNRVVAGTKADLRTTHVELRGVRLHRDGARVDHVKLRYRAAPVAGRLSAPLEAGTHRRAAVELASPVDGAAPGQVACLLDGDTIVGWATIAAEPAATPASAA